MDQARKTTKCVVVEIKCLADFARGRAPAVSDAVCGHGRTELPTALANVLNCLFAFIAARQIEIDVGPFASFLGKKPLKQKLHADRIDGRDAQRVTDGAVCRRAAPLDKDVMLATKLD